MLRTTAVGNDSGRYTIGSPSLGIPATVVDDTSMNFHQEEIVNTVEAAGITLGAAETQLRDAVIALVASGGTKISSAVAIANNTSGQDVTPVLLDKTVTRAARIFMHAHRRTDSSNVNEAIVAFAQHNPETDGWTVQWDGWSEGPNAGLTFTITAAGQLKFDADDLAGTSYSATLRVNHIDKLDIA